MYSHKRRSKRQRLWYKKDWFETEKEYRNVERLKLWVNERGEARLYDEYTPGLVSENLDDCDDRGILHFTI